MTVKRPMLWLSSSVVAGMYAIALFGIEAAFTVFFCYAIFLILYRIKKQERFTFWILLVCYVLFSFGAIRYSFVEDITRRPLYAHLGQVVDLCGEVQEIESETEKYIRFTMNANAVSIDEHTQTSIKEKISVIYFKYNSSDHTEIKRGDILSLECKISLPDDAMNTGGFSYRRYLYAKKIYFNAVIQDDTVTVTGRNRHLLKDFIYHFRMRCASCFDNVFPPDERGVLKAYILGDSSSIGDAMQEQFSASGLSHILAVSGTHVAVFLASFTYFLTFIKTPKRKQLFLSALATVFFVFFTGASVATIRAGFICVLSIIAQFVYRRADPLTSLCEAASIFCIINPMVIWDASFLLSFSAMLGIILFSNDISDRFSVLYQKQKPNTRVYRFLRGICSLTAVGISANLLVIPVLIYLFKEFSVLSVVTTLFITPVLSPLLIGGLLFCIVACIYQPIAFPIAGFLYLCVKYMVWIAQVFGKLFFSKISIGGITPFFILFYILLLSIFYFMFVKRNKTGYLISLYSVTMLLFVVLLYSISTQNILNVSFINVGQGDCSVIEAPGNCDIIIDGGGKSKDYSIGENIIKPYLMQNNIHDIEYAFASHGHEDHINGLIGLMDVVKIKQLFVPKGFGNTNESKQLLQKAKDKNIPVTYLKHGDVITLGNRLHLTVIMPDEKVLSLSNDENTRSLMLKVQYGDVSFLYTGDLSGDALNYTTTTYPQMLASNVLKVAHHGSDETNSLLFLKTALPTYAYIPVGENSYGHPAPNLLNRLRSENIMYYRADIHKDVTFYCTTNKITGIRYGNTDDTGGQNELR